MLGWGEFELEVMRDKHDNVVIIASIENIDPMGVHTGDCVTVAPQQTLSDAKYQELRDQAIAIIRAIGVETGGSNVQFAVNPKNGEIVVIEMNPRVSRSSALASKATGFPIAKIAARLAVGYTLDEIPNDITQKTTAAFEPTLDYVVVKLPRFAFEKFPGADDVLTSQMKSVGEAMSIAPTFRQAFEKAMALARARPPAGARSLQGRAADPPEAPLRRPLRAAVRGVPQGSHGRRAQRQHEHRPVVPAGSSSSFARRNRRRTGPGTRLPRRRHLRRRVRGRHAVLLLRLRTRRPRRPESRDRPRRQTERDHPRLRPEPDRPGNRVRLLLRARRDDRARARPRRGDGQLQPRDRLDRLRHLRPPLLRAADARGRARRSSRSSSPRA